MDAVAWPIVPPEPLTKPPLRRVSHVDPPLAPWHHTWCDPISIFVDPTIPDDQLEESICRAFAAFWVAGVQDFGTVNGERLLIVYRATPNTAGEPTLQ